jgi:hypothetical protein
MNLKKTDKLIAVIGIVILIVAAVGILLYIESDDNGNGNGDNNVMDTYTVNWMEESNKMEINGYAGKSGAYADPIPIDVESGCVLTSVEFSIVWRDDYTHGSLLNTGRDKLNADISLEGGEPQTHSSTGGANATIGDAFKINDKPMDEIFEDVDDIFEVEEIIKGKYVTMNSANFDVNVRVNRGEKLFPPRPMKILNYIRDKGNGFTLIVSYTYYKPDILSSDGPPEDDGGDEEPPDNNGTMGEYYRDTSRGRDI